MRQLTASQKKLIDKEMSKDKELSCAIDLPSETLEAIEVINDTEILYQEIDRYMHDKKWERLR